MSDLIHNLFLPGLLHTAAVAEENSPDLFLQLMVKAVLAAAL